MHQVSFYLKSCDFLMWGIQIKLDLRFMCKRFEQQELLRSEILIEHEQSDFASLSLKLYVCLKFWKFLHKTDYFSSLQRAMSKI